MNYTPNIRKSSQTFVNILKDVEAVAAQGMSLEIHTFALP